MTGAESGGSYFTLEVSVAPGGGPPPHIHHLEEEQFYVLEGELTFQVGGQSFRGPTQIPPRRSVSQPPEGGWPRAIGHPCDDLLRAFLRSVQRGVNLDIIDAMPVDDLVLRPGLAQGAVAARLLALLQHVEGAAHADEIGGQIGEQRDALVQPGRLDQHVVGEHVAARAESAAIA